MSTSAFQSGGRSRAEDTSPGETERLAALRRYQVLDTAQEPAFDRIVRLAALLLDVPIALISLIDADRQWFKARYGLDAPETPRAIAFCDHAIRGRDILVVPDAELDPRFCDNPLVTGEMHVRFYAGAPLATHDGFALGTICAIDRAPRQLNPRDAAVLTALAEQVIHELEVRAALGELYREVAEGRRATRTLQGEGARLEALLNATGNAVVTTDTDGQVASLNRAAEAMFRLEPGECLGLDIGGLISSHLDIDREVLTGSTEGNGRRKDGTEFPIEISRADWIDAQGHKASGAILRDLTERHRIEADLRSREAADRAQDKLAALGRVAGGVAHELNNLLQLVIGLTQLELDSLPAQGSSEQAETRESLATILECGNQMRSVVRKILMFSRKTKPERKPFDFPAVLNRACTFAGKLLPPGIHVNKVVGNDVVGLATIDEAELVEVLTNLAVNASYAMEGRYAIGDGRSSRPGRKLRVATGNPRRGLLHGCDLRYGTRHGRGYKGADS